jgi:hypothetical protein
LRPIIEGSVLFLGKWRRIIGGSVNYFSYWPSYW